MLAVACSMLDFGGLEEHRKDYMFSSHFPQQNKPIPSTDKPDEGKQIDNN